MGATSLIHHCSALIHDEAQVHNETPPPFRCLIVDAGAVSDVHELVMAIRQVLKGGDILLEHSIAQMEQTTNEIKELIRRKVLPEHAIAQGRYYSRKNYQGTYSNPLTELRELAYTMRDYNLGFDPTIIIDNMNDTKLAHNLFGRQRDDLWEIPLRWVVCGRLSRRTEYLTPPADAFFDTELILEPLDDLVARSLLEARINSTNSSDAEKAEKIRSHLHEIVRHSNGNPRQLLNKARSIALKQQSNEGTDEHVLAYASTLADTERSVLQYLQYHGPTSASDAKFQDYIDVTRERLTQVLRKLEHNGLVFSFLDKSDAGRPRKCYFSRQVP